MDTGWRFTPEMGTRLRRLRVRAELTQSELATRLGLEARDRRKLVGRIERGRAVNPGLRALVLWLRASGTLGS